MFLRQDEETGSLHQPGPCELSEGGWLASRQTPGIHVSTLLMLGLQKCATMLGLFITLVFRIGFNFSWLRASTLLTKPSSRLWLLNKRRIDR